MKIKAFFIILFMVLACKDNNIRVEKIAEVNQNFKADSVIKPPLLKIEKTFLLGKFDYKTHPDFVQVDLKLSSKRVYLQNETYEAFLRMQKAAEYDTIQLIIVSGTRNFEEQKAIWNRKWNRYNNLKPIDRIKKILEYSSMPSTSRHHWGTDMDLNNLNNSYFTSGKGKRIYDWLTNNANKYGFYQVYTDKTNGRTGYNLERWHWSYLPLASIYLNQYKTNINYSDIDGFEGSDFAEDIKVIPEFVNGVSEKVKTFKNR
ncbi:MAG: M15 family metallopeptidase [Winogradskyella sp.]|uniref:M15 family metallopeptidase n=1 Tax=Winogradskyella sp. TaxID=1883156 RepID=UPI0017EB20FB|nr:M15 family metallopeptidase [Winogradskyella sp.]MBT8244098.1 M15 family metallopeptidase [Winogradskyella sp.]NNK23604.1 M15 family metallopeptidase [Winogradskyella sp.]